MDGFDKGDFGIACMRLLSEFPLYRYAVPHAGGKKRLDLLLLGSGEKLNKILENVLTCGQMLDTELCVTVVFPPERDMAKTFLERAPAAVDFIRVIKDGEILAQPEAPLCTLRFQQMSLSSEKVPDILLAHEECSYLLISTGSAECDTALARVCAACGTDQERLIAYAQGETIRPEQGIALRTELYAISAPDNSVYFEKMKQIAFNLHYIYEKRQNVRQPLWQIEESFRDPYNYTASLESALHIPTKLACCGIDCGDLNAAAHMFSQKLQKQKKLLERLTALEHARWTMSKILKGYRFLPDSDMSLIYSAPNVGTYDRSAKWHCCIVPCDMSGNSRLKESDWDIPYEQCRAGLDPLDRITLRIHNECKKIATKNRPQIEMLLKDVRNTLTLEAGYFEDEINHERLLESALEQMWANKSGAAAVFSHEMEILQSRIRDGNHEQSNFLMSTLQRIDQAAAPLVEYVGCKDYKEIDRVVVQQIPYVLTRRARLVLGKTLSPELSENLYAMWQLEPQKTVYFAAVQNDKDIRMFAELAGQILQFVNAHCQETKVAFHMAVKRRIWTQSQWELPREVCVHALEGLSIEALRELTGQIQQESGVCAWDISGGDPQLNHAVCKYAEQHGIGIFFARSGGLCDLFSAEEFTYPMPHKALTVREMFDMTGAVPEKTETSTLSDAVSDYNGILQFALKSVPETGSIIWNTFCTDVGSAHKNSQRFVDFSSHKRHPAVSIETSAPSDAAAALYPALQELETRGYIRGVCSGSTPDSPNTVLRFILKENVAIPEEIEDFLRLAVEDFCTGTCFSAEEKKEIEGSKEIKKYGLFASTLQVYDFLPKERKADYSAILSELKERKWIEDHRIDRKTGAHSFCFATREMLTCCQKGGNLLERAIYFSALMDGRFDDVEIGWEFHHTSAENAAKNEIDVICTHGLRSLFISAKMVARKNLTKSLNYIFYEILLEAQDFGVNALPVLVAPTLEQNQENNPRALSSQAQLALSRGVYLIGKECIQKDKIGQTLYKIISGDKDWFIV